MKVTFPWWRRRPSRRGPAWRWPAPGAKRGLVVLPEVGDEVLVAFDHGDARLPFVVGGLYNGKDELPVEAGQRRQGRDPRPRLAQRPPVELHDKDDTVTIATGDGKHRSCSTRRTTRSSSRRPATSRSTSDAKLTVTAPSGVTFESSGDLESRATA